MYIVLFLLSILMQALYIGLPCLSVNVNCGVDQNQCAQLNIYYLYLVTTYKYLFFKYVKIEYKTLARESVFV